MKTETNDTPMDYKQFEGHTPEKQAEHFQLYDAISKIPNGLDFLKAVNAGIDENKSLKLELQKQKELNAELVNTLKIARRELIEVNKKDMWEIEPTLFLIEDAIRNLESLIKKSSEI